LIEKNIQIEQVAAAMRRSALKVGCQLAALEPGQRMKISCRCIVLTIQFGRSLKPLNVRSTATRGRQQAYIARQASRIDPLIDQG
jgi:hypothetical protein